MADKSITGLTAASTLDGTELAVVTQGGNSRKSTIKRIIEEVVHALTGKTTPVDADEMLITDSAASNVGKKVTWANVKATLKAYFDTLYASAASVIADGDKGDITVSSSATVWTIDNDVVTNAKAANMATATFKGRTTAGTGDPEDLSVTQATALLNAVVGDSGSGGTKGLVPAPGSGDAAAGKFLKADGSFAVPPGTAGGVGDGDKGDITVSSTGTVWTIDNDVVTYAKMQNVSATQRLLGRNTAGSGDTEEVTTTQAIDWIGSTRGQVLYRGSSAWSALATGTAGQALLTGGAGADPSWGTIVRPTVTANFTAGYTATAYNAGTQTTGTLTPDPANGNIQRAVNGGAHTLAPPSVGGGDSLTMVIQYTNNGSAGTLTTSGFTKKTGDALTTVNGDDFLFHITVINGFSHLNVVALQ